MKFSIRNIGKSIIELTVDNEYGNTVVADITDFDGVVPQTLIDNINDIVLELEQHNYEIQNKVK